MNKLKRCRKIEFIDTYAYYKKDGKFNKKLYLSTLVSYFLTIYMQSELNLVDDEFINFIKYFFAGVVGYSTGIAITDYKKIKLATEKIKLIEQKLNEKGIEISFADECVVKMKNSNELTAYLCFGDREFECTKDSIIYTCPDNNMDVTDEINKVLKYKK